MTIPAEIPFKFNTIMSVGWRFRQPTPALLSIFFSYCSLVSVSGVRLQRFFGNPSGVQPMKRSSLLAQLALLFLLGAIPCLMSGPSPTASPGEAVKGISKKKIEQWIKDLGSDSFEEREVAMRALMDLEEEPMSLRKELKSPDLEVRRRVAKILEAHVPKRAKRGLAKIKILAKEGRIDEMAERLVLWKKYDTGEGWKALVELAAKIAACADFTYEGKTYFQRVLKPEERGESRELIYDKTQWKWIPKSLEGVNLTKGAKEKLIWKNLTKHWQSVLKPVREEKINIDRKENHNPLKLPGQRVILASGDVEGIQQLCECIIVAVGNLQLRAASGSVVVCAGDCEIRGSIQNSLIIVRGKITTGAQGGGCDTSVICGEDFIDMTGFFRLCLSVVNSGRNGFVKFFDPVDVGIIAYNYYRKGKVVPNGARILKVCEGTPFASKLQPEDAVTAIDETKTPTFEVFRRVLRRKLAEGGPLITFTVRRADKTLEVPIPVKD